MWEIIANLFRKVFDFLSISGEKAVDSTESEGEFIKVETDDLENSDPGVLNRRTLFRRRAGKQKLQLTLTRR